MFLKFELLKLPQSAGHLQLREEFEVLKQVARSQSDSVEQLKLQARGAGGGGGGVAAQPTRSTPRPTFGDSTATCKPPTPFQLPL